MFLIGEVSRTRSREKKDTKPWSKVCREKSAEAIVCLETSLPKQDSKRQEVSQGQKGRTVQRLSK